MLRKELLQLRRDRLTFAMMTGIPAIQLLLFGFAIQTEVRHLPTVVLDESATQQSRALIDRMVNTGNFDLVRTVPDREALRAEIESGRARAAIVIPPDYARDLLRGRTAHAQVQMPFKDHFGRANEENIMKCLNVSGRMAGFEFYGEVTPQGFNRNRR